MQTCLTPLAVLALAVFIMMTLIRWFEQVTEAVDRQWWNKVFLLVAMPFAVWLYPSRVSAGRPSMVPRHEPVRGFGKVSLTPTSGNGDKTAAAAGVPPPPAPTDGPPPGTPPEFLGMPVIPPKRRATRPAVDPEKLKKLKQKMREQGMLPDEEEEGGTGDR